MKGLKFYLAISLITILYAGDIILEDESPLADKTACTTQVDYITITKEEWENIGDELNEFIQSNNHRKCNYFVIKVMEEGEQLIPDTNKTNKENKINVLDMLRVNNPGVNIVAYFMHSSTGAVVTGLQ